MIFIGSLQYHNFNQLTHKFDKNHHEKWLGRVEKISKKENHTEITFNVIAFSRGINHESINVLSKLDHNHGLKIGDVIKSESQFKPFNRPYFSTQFDYASFMENRRIIFNTKIDDWELIDHQFKLSGTAQTLRAKATKIFKLNNISGKSYHILNALILGDKSLLDQTTRNNFSRAGVMHILAVSGLHVGIIYLILNFCFSLIKSSKLTVILKVLLSLFFIWTFALMTGLSPSVQRAAFMFSVIAIGESLKRPNYTVNSIFGSALVLLLINPNLLFEVGFQLSYSAVLGIVIVFPVIKSLFHFKNKLLKYIFELTLISIIAQIATLPIALYYFHQFPNYFILFNLIVIPLTFLIVIFALIVLVSSFIPPLSSTFGYILNALLELLQLSVNQVSKIDSAFISDLYLDKVELSILVLITISILFFLGKIYKKGLLMAMFGLLSLLFYNNIHILEGSTRIVHASLNVDNEEFNIVMRGRQAMIKLDSTHSTYKEKLIRDYLVANNYFHLSSIE